MEVQTLLLFQWKMQSENKKELVKKEVLGEGEYLYLGVARFQVGEEEWKHWARKCENQKNRESVINLDANQQQSKPLIQPRFNRFCKLEKQNKQQMYYSATYNLTIISNDGLETNIFRNVKMKHSSQHEIEQLQDLQLIQLVKPVCLPVSLQPVFHFVRGLKNVDQDIKVYEIGVEVRVKKQFLEKCTLRSQKTCRNRLAQIDKNGYVRYPEQDQLQKIIRNFKILFYSLISANSNGEQEAKQFQQSQPEKEDQNQENQPHDKEDMRCFFADDLSEQKSKVISYNCMNDIDPGHYFDILDCEIEPLNQPKGFVGQLKMYQKKALSWILFREGVIKNDSFLRKSVNVPFWTDLTEKLKLPYYLYFNERLNLIQYNEIPIKQCNGGILADEMGLGKTIMMISLILSHRPARSSNKQTLIIAPATVKNNWKQQIEKFAPSLQVLVFTGSTRISDIHKYDVVIVSEGKIRAQKQKQMKASDEETLCQLQWFRVIIDEAHNFRNHKTKMFGAVLGLNAEYRWCLSGTPKQNSTHDLLPLCKFLQLSPWNNSDLWETTFPKKDKDIHSSHILELKLILKGIMLRRKKNSKDQEGNILVQLPKADVKLHYVKMNYLARTIYRMINGRAQQRLEQLQNIDKLKKNELITKQKKSFLMKKRNHVYQSLLGLIVKLRMICCHAFLANYTPDYVSYFNFESQYHKFLKKKKVKRFPRSNFFELMVSDQNFRKWSQQKTDNLSKVYGYYMSKFQKIATGYQEPCGLCNCFDPNIQITPCLHFFCRDCIAQHILSIKQKQQRQELQMCPGMKDQKKIKISQFVGECPTCYDELKIEELFPAPRENSFGIRMDLYEPNQKIQELISYLKKMKETDKAVVYTNFRGMVQLIAISLKKIQLAFLTLQGKDSTEFRNARLEEFTTNPKIKVLIITIKIGSVGLNLQAANKVFIMDPWWNPSIQEQAIARCHRFGQTKQVEAIKFVTEQSIQAKIIKDSHNKKSIIDSILDIDQIGTNLKSAKPQIRFLLQMEEDEITDNEEYLRMSEEEKQHFRRYEQALLGRIRMKYGEYQPKVKGEYKQEEECGMEEQGQQQMQIQLQEESLMSDSWDL